MRACACVCENLFLLIGGSVMILVGLGLKALEMEVYGMVCVSVLSEIIKFLYVCVRACVCVCVVFDLLF